MMENRTPNCQNNNYRTVPNCQTATNHNAPWQPAQVPSKMELMQRINQYSFAVDEVLLFLDTHPYDMEAMKYFQKYRALRQEAIQDYSKYYAPLLVDYAVCDKSPWSWVNEPWPWEGVDC